MMFVVGTIAGIIIGVVCTGRYVVGYWPRQGEDAARKAGW